MTKRARWDGPGPVAIFDSEAGVYAPPIVADLQPGQLLPTETDQGDPMPARIRDEFLHKDNPFGNDFRIALSKETVYATRVAPARFFPVTGEDIAFSATARSRRRSAWAAGRARRRHSRPAAAPARSAARSRPPGSGTCSTRCTATPSRRSQQAATTAYLQTHTLDTPPTKSYSIQKQVPPVLTSTLVPLDYTGAMFTGITFSWSPAGLLTYSMP
jgi:hypothetical protein